MVNMLHEETLNLIRHSQNKTFYFYLKNNERTKHQKLIYYVQFFKETIQFSRTFYFSYFLK